MREQIRRLDKTPGTEVQQGVLQTGVTQTPTMGYVQQKESKGSKLAKTLGMVTDTAIKGYELYQGQKDEEAMSQFYTDRLTTIEEMNALNSDADRALYLQDKMRSLSNEGVNEKYRESFIKTFSGSYSKALAGAKIEGYKAQENELFKRLSTDINGEDFNYDNLISEFGTRVRKENVHGLYATAILQNAQIDLSSVTNLNQLKEVKEKYDSVFATYNSNPYAGGSKSKNAIDLQLKLDKGFNTLINAKTKEFKESYDLSKAQNFNEYNVTPAVFEANSQQAAGYNLKTEAEHYTDVVKYQKEYKAFTDFNEWQNNEYDPLGGMSAANYNSLNEKQKKHVKENTIKNIEFNLSKGYFKNASDFVNKVPSIGGPYMKSLFTSDDDSETVKKKLESYRGFRDSVQGRTSLANLDKNTRAMYEILTHNPNASIESIQNTLINPTPFNFGEDKADAMSDWNKVLKKLSPKERATATALRDYYYNTTLDTDSAIRMVEDNFVSETVHKIGKPGIRGFSKVNTSGFDNEEQAEYYVGGIADSFGEYYEFDSVTVDGNNIVIKDSKFPANEVNISFREMDKIYAARLISKVDSEQLDFQDMIEVMSSVKGSVSDYMDTWKQVASGGEWLDTAALAIPIGVGFQSVKQGYGLYKWMKNTNAVGDFVIDLSSKVVSRGNLQKGSDLLQKAGYNVKVANNGKRMTVSKNYTKSGTKGTTGTQGADTFTNILGGGIALGAGAAVVDGVRNNTLEMIGNTTVAEVVNTVDTMSEQDIENAFESFTSTATQETPIMRNEGSNIFLKTVLNKFTPEMVDKDTFTQEDFSPEFKNKVDRVVKNVPLEVKGTTVSFDDLKVGETALVRSIAYKDFFPEAAGKGFMENERSVENILLNFSVKKEKDGYRIIDNYDTGSPESDNVTLDNSSFMYWLAKNIGYFAAPENKDGSSKDPKKSNTIAIDMFIKNK